MEKNRQDILEGKLTGSGDDRFKTVKASIATNDDKFDISLRIKGDRIQNFINMDSISYKIKINKNESFKNMRKFSLIKPRIRNYIHEWLFHEFGRTQNLTTINYDFVYLNVNGKNNGLYAIEENFDSWLIEKNKDRYGPIFSMREEFDEDFMSSEFELYNKNFWKKDENLLLASTAIKKLKLFQEGKNTLEDTFDLNQWAKYFSIIDLTYTFHGASPRNVKFFFNPITSLFEPIPYDGHRVIVNYNKNITNYDHSTLFDKAKNGMVSGRTYLKNKNDLSIDTETSLIRIFFYNKNGELNTSFIKKYFSYIYKNTDENFLKNFFDSRETKIKEINSAIYADYFLIDNNYNNKYGPGFYYFSKKDIFFRANYLREKFKPEISKIYISEDENNIYLTNRSPFNLGLNINYLECITKDNDGVTNKFKIFYDLNLDLNYQQTINKRITLNNSNKCENVNFLNQNNLENFEKEINFFLESKYENKKKDLSYKNYFNINENVLFLKSDKITIDKDITIPANHIIKIKSGQKIELINNAIIISYSPWEAIGKNSIINIGGNEKNFGGGIYIINTNNLSRFENVKFNYLAGVENRILKNPNSTEDKFLITSYIGFENKYSTIIKNLDSHKYMMSDAFKITGAITIYGGDTIVDNCNFEKISSEDAINLISSISILNNLKFNENLSDSIDIDFGQSEIKNSEFLNIKGDGIDVSGANIEIKNIKFSNIFDKAISVGEESSVTIREIYGKNTFIGVAVKDGSYASVSNLKFDQVEYPFASYQKKKFYKFPTLEILENVETMNYNKKYIKDLKSTIKYENSFIKDYNNEILDLIYERGININS